MEDEVLCVWLVFTVMDSMQSPGENTDIEDRPVLML